MVGLFIIYCRGIITQLILGYHQKEVSDYLLFLSFVPLIVSLNVPAYQALLIHKKKWGYSTIIILGAILSVLLNLIFTPIFLAKGTIISIIITELFVTFGLHFVIYFKYSKYRFL
jgi:O-antigen/teichoic acid export membrane protein